LLSWRLGFDKEIEEMHEIEGLHAELENIPFADEPGPFISCFPRDYLRFETVETIEAFLYAKQAIFHHYQNENYLQIFGLHKDFLTIDRWNKACEELMNIWHPDIYSKTFSKNIKLASQQGLTQSSFVELSQMLRNAMLFAVAEVDILRFKENLSYFELYDQVNAWIDNLLSNTKADPFQKNMPKDKWLQMWAQHQRVILELSEIQVIPAMKPVCQQLFLLRGDSEACYALLDDICQRVKAWVITQNNRLKKIEQDLPRFRSKGIEVMPIVSLRDSISSIAEHLSKIESVYVDKWLFLQKELLLSIAHWLKTMEKTSAQVVFHCLVESQALGLADEGPWLHVSMFEQWFNHPDEWLRHMPSFDAKCLRAYRLYVYHKQLEEAWLHGKEMQWVNAASNASSLLDLHKLYLNFQKDWAGDFDQVSSCAYAKKIQLDEPLRAYCLVLFSHVLLTYAKQSGYAHWADASTPYRVDQNLRDCLRKEASDKPVFDDEKNIQQMFARREPQLAVLDRAAQSGVRQYPILRSVADFSDDHLRELMQQTCLDIETIKQRKRLAVMSPHCLRVYQSRGDDLLHAQAINLYKKALIECFTIERYRVERLEQDILQRFKHESICDWTHEKTAHLIEQLHVCNRHLEQKYQDWLLSEIQVKPMIKRWQQKQGEGQAILAILRVLQSNAEKRLFDQDEAVLMINLQEDGAGFNVSNWSAFIPKWMAGYAKGALPMMGAQLQTCVQLNQDRKQARLLAQQEDAVKHLHVMMRDFSSVHMDNKQLLNRLLHNWQWLCKDVGNVQDQLPDPSHPMQIQQAQDSFSSQQQSSEAVMREVDKIDHCDVSQREEI
jgi:hypothetical protein